MSEPRSMDQLADDESEDPRAVEWAAELADRIQAGELVDLEEVARAEPDKAMMVRRLLPAIEMMAALAQTEESRLVTKVSRSAILTTVRSCSGISNSSANSGVAAWGSSTKPASYHWEVAASL